MIINNWCSNTTLLIWLYNNILPRRRAPAEDIADSTDSSPNGEFSYPTRYDAYWPKQVKTIGLQVVVMLLNYCGLVKTEYQIPFYNRT